MNLYLGGFRFLHCLAWVLDFFFIAATGIRWPPTSFSEKVATQAPVTEPELDFL